MECMTKVYVIQSVATNQVLDVLTDENDVSLYCELIERTGTLVFVTEHVTNSYAFFI